MMKNWERSALVIEELRRLGAEEFVICAGARNAPLVKWLGSRRGLQCWYFPEERSAAFFALGRMKDHGQPVAVVTTSGTAAAELLPAAIEGSFSGLPLILVTADRPRRFRGSGAPQVIEQVGLFTTYVEKCVDVDGDEALDLSAWSKMSPLHVNVCFDEPLLDFDEQSVTTSKTLHHVSPPGAVEVGKVSLRLEALAPRLRAWRQRATRPLLMVGPLPRSQRERILTSLPAGAPVLAEGLSGLREKIDTENRIGEDLARQGLLNGRWDSVIRLGGVPTTRVWRDLEGPLAKVPVLVLSHLPWRGLSRTDVEVLPEAWVGEALGNWNFEADPWWRQHVLDESRRLNQLIETLPLAEPSWIRWLSLQMGRGAKVYLGNSLPVREWDLAAAPKSGLDYEGNRGANGIDGQVSTFLGWASPSGENWAVLGDLTVLYDLAGFWAARERTIEDGRLVVINNGGGKIFSPMFHDPRFENVHGLNFSNLAEFWGWSYQRLESEDQQRQPLQSGRMICEVVPNPKQTDAFWQDWGARRQ